MKIRLNRLRFSSLIDLLKTFSNDSEQFSNLKYDNSTDFNDVNERLHITYIKFFIHGLSKTIKPMNLITHHIHCKIWLPNQLSINFPFLLLPLIHVKTKVKPQVCSVQELIKVVLFFYIPSSLLLSHIFLFIDRFPFNLNSTRFYRWLNWHKIYISIDCFCKLLAKKRWTTCKNTCSVEFTFGRYKSIKIK